MTADPSPAVEPDATPDPRTPSRPGRGVALEIAVQDVAGARAAAAGGADRVELCAALAGTGGLTPSAGMVAAVADALRGTGVGAHVLVRSRAGGFVPAPDEVDVQVRDVRAVLEAGADGVVVGALTADGRVDAATLAALVAAADGAEVTFHRAIDQVERPVEILETLAAAGVRRVLTSGGAARAGDGLDVLAALADRGRELGVEIMAGGGVRTEDVAALVAAGVDAVHLSARRTVSADGGPGGGGTGGYDVTDPAAVAAARAALDAALGATPGAAARSGAGRVAP
ncbi:copper homeostasis protein CutC [Isoptericola cucumis]|uniref:PF03932 family protein CutC n=1 Tax=Isoptericola cucumis TaxID=1776856 RepID=A0ABQ2B2N2_9MICO|nr:copper homeostasis protein CutC [Isoptericola cucumis]